MGKHADNEPVLVGYSSSRNIRFKGKDEELGVTWGEWREMDETEQGEILAEFLFSLVDVYVEEEE